jgi:hypothetical protein
MGIISRDAGFLVLGFISGVHGGIKALLVGPAFRRPRARYHNRAKVAGVLDFMIHRWAFWVPNLGELGSRGSFGCVRQQYGLFISTIIGCTRCIGIWTEVLGHTSRATGATYEHVNLVATYSMTIFP